MNPCHLVRGISVHVAVTRSHMLVRSTHAAAVAILSEKRNQGGHGSYSWLPRTDRLCSRCITVAVDTDIAPVCICFDDRWLDTSTGS